MKLDKEVIALADQILRSYYFEAGPRRANRNSDRMMPGVRAAPMRIDFPIFVDLLSIKVAALMLRKLNKKAFGSVPLNRTEDFILKSLDVDISRFFGQSIPAESSRNYLNTIGKAERDRFHLLVANDLLAGPPTQTFSFPLSKVSIASAYSGSNFYVLSGDDVGSENPQSIIEKYKIKQSINGWIGCTASFPEGAQKIKRIALGAISLRLPYIERTQKTLAKPANGFVTHKQLGWSSSREHMPPLSYDITIKEEDKGWLDKIDDLISNSKKKSRHLRKALEYFYLGWFLEPNERIAFNFLALDAVFGQSQEGTARGFKTGLSETLNQTFDGVRLRDILNLRNQFFHGGSPDIYDSTRYDCYLRIYNCDPIIDIEYITASCLRRLVFGADFAMQPNPYQAEIQKLKDRGLIPTQPSQQTIIQEN
ncbi:MAG: hypothetical protein RIC18_02755 [Hoeflea sp.]|uniref:hypothetical protein n=1 Tax=Hoeflea sp. TaxID=1940281 RepID=UPI0032EE43EC